ncbi:hypothetical protein G9A89_007160 [Geosiphon pyriformis]|nr:hypothetical protein G9A89_007160 [Geosiphon pyriformis]
MAGHAQGNAPTHITKAVQKFFISQRVKLLSWPPQIQLSISGWDFVNAILINQHSGVRANG